MWEYISVGVYEVKKNLQGVMYESKKMVYDQWNENACCPGRLRM